MLNTRNWPAPEIDVKLFSKECQKITTMCKVNKHNWLPHENTKITLSSFHLIQTYFEFF